jgi:hypothetical protein
MSNLGGCNANLGTASSRAGLVGGLVAAVAALLICACNPQNAVADTLEVGSGGYATIGAAVHAASSGDTVLIHAGTYREEVNLSGKAITVRPYGDGPVTVDGECQRDHGVYIGSGSGMVVQGLTVKRTIAASILIERASKVTIDGMTIQDFDCQGAGDVWRAGIASWYGGSNITITNNTIRFRTSGSPHGQADGIWFKSSDAKRSGGGHYIAGNTIIGGWDGIGGEEEASAHGTFDRNTIVENNTIRDCWDDGIQSEGGDDDVHIRNNDISGCGAGIAFAAPVTGPLYVERNRIHDLSLGLYESLFCFKVGNAGGGTTYLTENVCDVDSSAEAAQGGADGIHQTNEDLSPIVSRRNTFQVSGYVFILTESPLPPGTSFDEDCVSTTDPDRFIKWSGGERFGGLAELQAVGQEPNGRQTTDCSFLGTSTPLPSPTPSPQATAGATSSSGSPGQTPASQPTPGSAQQTPASQPTPGSTQQTPASQPTPGSAQQTPSGQPTPGSAQPTPSGQPTPSSGQQTPSSQPTPGSAQQTPSGQPTTSPEQTGDSNDGSDGLSAPLAVGIGGLAALILLGLAFIGGRGIRRGRRTP